MSMPTLGASGAIVSLSGRADLAAPVLPFIYTPTLLIVGSYDVSVQYLSVQVFNQLAGEKRLEVAHSGGKLFEESHSREEVAQMSIAWFRQFLLTPEPLPQAARPAAAMRPAARPTLQPGPVAEDAMLARQQREWATAKRNLNFSD